MSIWLEMIWGMKIRLQVPSREHLATNSNGNITIRSTLGSWPSERFWMFFGLHLVIDACRHLMGAVDDQVRTPPIEAARRTDAASSAVAGLDPPELSDAFLTHLGNRYVRKGLRLAEDVDLTNYEPSNAELRSLTHGLGYLICKPSHEDDGRRFSFGVLERAWGCQIYESRRAVWMDERTKIQRFMMTPDNGISDYSKTVELDDERR